MNSTLTRYAAYALSGNLERTGARALKAWPIPFEARADGVVLKQVQQWVDGYLARHEFVTVEIVWERLEAGRVVDSCPQGRTYGRIAQARLAEKENCK